jgi:hypothetical protein
MLPQKPNRRRFPRVLLPGHVNLRCQGEGFRGRLRVLGEGGMFIDTIHPLPDGTEAEVTILADGEPIHVRCVSRDHDPGCGMGVEFLRLCEVERDRIRELIARFNS